MIAFMALTAPSLRNVPLAVQMWTLTGQFDLAKEMARALEGVRAAGFTAIETFMDEHLTPGMLKDAGVRAVAVHASTPRLPDPSALIDRCRELGAEHAAVSGPRHWDRRALADYRDLADILNNAGPRLAEAGIGLHYHNHDFEFARIEGFRTAMDKLVDWVRPEAAGFCVDAGWAHVAGTVPERWIGDNGPRISALHLRDFRGRDSMELGCGEVDQAGLLRQAGLLPNLAWIAVEQEPRSSPDAVHSLRVSREFLRSHFGL